MPVMVGGLPYAAIVAGELMRRGKEFSVDMAGYDRENGRVLVPNAYKKLLRETNVIAVDNLLDTGRTINAITAILEKNCCNVTQIFAHEIID
jgi:adenine/guanine phosphoribosyltransferase-like PRPP-binding protein